MPSYVVVGASRGLGYEWLRHLSSDAANTVIGLARTAAPVESKLAADKITTVHVLEADMINPASLNTAAADVTELTNGSIDYLIVNGAFSDPNTQNLLPTAFIGREGVLRKDMITSLEVNVLGVMHSINAFLPLIRKSYVKKIIVISTGLADTENVPKTGNPSFVTYSSMKAALNMVVAKYSVELKEEGIIVLALSPGIVTTRETPPTAEDITYFQRFKERVQKANPDWKGPMMPAESVLFQKQVIECVTIKDTGSLLSHLGNKQWI